MKTIYKYPLEIQEEQTIEMPFDPQILCVQVQNGKPFIWALVETENEPEHHLIRIFGTGQEIGHQDVIKYIGTFQIDWLVWHVFEGIWN